MKQIHLIIFLLFVCVITGCEKSNDVVRMDKDVEIETSEKDKIILPISYIEIPPFWSAIDYAHGGGTIFVIRSVDELRIRLESIPDNIPNVNFDKNSVLLVIGRARQNVYEVTCKLKSKKNMQYVLKVNVGLTWLQGADTWGKLVLTPVIPEESEVKIDVTYKVFEPQD